MSEYAYKKATNMLSYLGERPAPMVREAPEPLAISGIFLVVECS
jgi:hypothetical protein